MVERSEVSPVMPSCLPLLGCNEVEKSAPNISDDGITAAKQEGPPEVLVEVSAARFSDVGAGVAAEPNRRCALPAWRGMTASIISYPARFQIGHATPVRSVRASAVRVTSTSGRPA